MVSVEIENVIIHYLWQVTAMGIPISKAIVYGSQARGDAKLLSDIDLVLVSREFEPPLDRRVVRKLWELRAKADSRIEPIACGEKEWATDDHRVILEIARREGVAIPWS